MIVTKIQNWYDENRYYNLFFSIVLLILVPPFLYEVKFLSFFIYLLISFVIINCLIILFGHYRHWFRGIIVGLIVLMFIWTDVLVISDNLFLNLTSNVTMALIFGFTFARVVREIFGLMKITGQVVIGAIGAYLLLGLMGAFLFHIIEILYPNSYSLASDYSGFYAEIYFSFITISTLGYGDISPITPQGQAAAIFVSIAGQLYLTILMAMLVGKFLKDSDW